MRMALAEAEAAGRAGEVPVGAVVVAGEDVLGVGHNQPIGSHDPTAHAEIVALRAAAARVGNYRLTDATLYVTIEPCLMCVGALVHARIGTLVYGAPEPKAGAIESSQRAHEHPALNHRLVVVSGVLAVECASIVQQFFQRRRAEVVVPVPGQRGENDVGVHEPLVTRGGDVGAYVEAVLGLVGDRDPLEILRATPTALERAVAGLSLDQMRRPERPGKWSIAAVLQHLADADVVWAWRMRLILAQDRPPITGYDQDLVGGAAALCRRRSGRGARDVPGAPAGESEAPRARDARRS